MKRSTQYVSQAVAGLLLLAATLCFVVSAQAASETPATLTGATVVTAEEARSLMAKGVPVIDARVANEYADEHIRGAKNVPYKEKSAKAANFDASQDSFALNELPADKAAPVIFYCNAGECWKSYKASHAAIKAGYTKVYWLRGGIPEWKKHGFPVE
jgi:rhodanese-related sulfurtransferase